jgi:superoxide dismutase, Cu-Zn family
VWGAPASGKLMLMRTGSSKGLLQRYIKRSRGDQMNSRTSVIRYAIVVGGVAVLVVGCGSGEGSNTAATTTPPAATTVSSAVGTTESASAAAESGAADGGAALVATADLLDPSGVEIGTVDFAVAGSVVTVSAEVEGLPAGFKGFHVHAIGKCEPNSANPNDPSKIGHFLSAGGHLGAGAGAHPGHDGDLTSLQVGADGSAELVTTTEAFDVEALFDADGSAVMVHAGPDNFGNIPTRYAPGGPDADTQATGDSGGRAACGVVEEIG